MIFLKLAIKSLINRKLSTLLTVLSISLSITLLLAVERTKRSAEEGFTQSISQVDLLVGAPTGPLNLILYTVFNMGSASNNVSRESYEDIKSKPEVEWTIPYSLGDGHQGFRVVGTDENFYKHYRFRGDNQVEFKEGQAALDIWDVTIGSEVYNKLKYKIGDKIIIAHGVTKGTSFQLHEDKPFRVVGILKPTGTPIDRSLYISLYGMEALHIDEEKTLSSKTTHGITKEDIRLGPITSFFLRTKNRIQILNLQRYINTYKEEPLLAILPGVTLAQLWQGLSQIDKVLRIISLLVFFIGLAAMVSTLLAGLNERRREMAILRALGSGPKQITYLFIFESFLLTSLSVLIGITMNLVVFNILSQWLELSFGFYVTSTLFSVKEGMYLLIILGAGTSIGFIPAYQASRLALKDGLTVKT